MQNVAFTTKHCMDSGGRINHNQEKVTFDFVSLASRLCSFLSMGLIFVPEAYKETLHGKKYVWLFIDWYPDNWYKVKDNHHICTVAFITESTVPRAKQFTEPLDRMLNTLDTSLITSEGTMEAPVAYNAVWVMAFAFPNAAPKLYQHDVLLPQTLFSTFNCDWFTVSKCWVLPIFGIFLAYETQNVPYSLAWAVMAFHASPSLVAFSASVPCPTLSHFVSPSNIF
ncbi:hypothetical protein RRG08_003467 [Elysia crispata]|uniref:Uncharacterized protein n=1 Tax=Elysia crispata TaxID=231223 RepID=A0AAE1CTK4_9GAST|nr:hypothetical protein RRG08_003467 [Elysia crispata]